MTQPTSELFCSDSGILRMLIHVHVKMECKHDWVAFAKGLYQTRRFNSCIRFRQRHRFLLNILKACFLLLSKIQETSLL